MFRTILALLFINCACYGQAVDNTASFRMMPSDQYIRLHYENDYFTATDYYYTQGINLEVVHPAFTKSPLNRILIPTKAGINQFGISFEHNGYTPTSIEHTEILYGDRPFAATMMLKAFSMSRLQERRMRVTSSLTMGVIGPAAGGYEMQKRIHEWIDYTIPLGWNNQIQNDLVLNYEASIEKNFLQAGKTLLINGFASGRAGTLNTKLSMGPVLIFGRLNHPIASTFTRGYVESSRKLRFHFYFQPLLNVVAYDATLQGGVFNRSSPYTIPASEVSHLTYQANYGVVMSKGGFCLEYFKSVISQEFETGLSHRWGGLRVGFKL